MANGNGFNWNAVGQSLAATGVVFAVGAAITAYTADSKADVAQASVVVVDEKVVELRKAAYKEIQDIKEVDHKQDMKIQALELKVDHIKEGVDSLVEGLLKDKE